jgi:hypothetical protein
LEVNLYLSVNSSNVCRITSAKATNLDTSFYGYLRIPAGSLTKLLLAHIFTPVLQQATGDNHGHINFTTASYASSASTGRPE